MAAYKYHPSSHPLLGYPIDPRRPYNNKHTGGYITWTDEQLDTSLPGATVPFKIEEVSSRKQLYELMSLDINIEAKFNLATVSSTLNYEQEFTFDENTLIYVAYGKKTYNPQTKYGVLKLSMEGEKFWDEVKTAEDILDFQRTVGTEVVTSIQRGNLVSIMYVFKCSSATNKQSIKGRLDVGWKTGSVAVDFNKELRSIDQRLSVSVDGFQSGVTSNQLDPRLSRIIALDPGNIVQIRKIVEEVINNVSESERDHSPIISFNTTNLSDVRSISRNRDRKKVYDSIITLDTVIDEMVIELNEKNVRNSIRIKKAQALWDNWNINDYQPGAKDLLRIQLDTLHKKRQELGEAYDKCVNAFNRVTLDGIKIKETEDLDYSKILVFPIILPTSWEININTFSTEPHWGTFATSMWPIVHLKFPPVIREVRILLNSKPIRVLKPEELEQLITNAGAFKDIWNIPVISERVHVPGWNPAILDAKRGEIRSYHIATTAGSNYAIEVVLDDGSADVVQLGNPKEGIPQAASHFVNLLDQFRNFNAYNPGVTANIDSALAGASMRANEVRHVVDDERAKQNLKSWLHLLTEHGRWKFDKPFDE